MEDPVANAILNQYFLRLEQALSELPAERRAQIVEDLRTHVEECLLAESVHSDATVLAILDRVGDPDEIAREALADETLPRAVDASPSYRPCAEVQLSGRRRSQALAGNRSGTGSLGRSRCLVIAVSSGGSSASPPKSSGPIVRGAWWRRIPIPLLLRVVGCLRRM